MMPFGGRVAGVGAAALGVEAASAAARAAARPALCWCSCCCCWPCQHRSARMSAAAAGGSGAARPAGASAQRRNAACAHSGMRAVRVSVACSAWCSAWCSPACSQLPGCTARLAGTLPLPQIEPLLQHSSRRGISTRQLLAAAAGVRLRHANEQERTPSSLPQLPRPPAWPCPAAWQAAGPVGVLPWRPPRRQALPWRAPTASFCLRVERGRRWRWQGWASGEWGGWQCQGGLKQRKPR